MPDKEQNEKEPGRDQQKEEAAAQKQENESKPRADSARTGRPLISGGKDK